MSEKKRCVIVGGADIGDYARVKQYLREDDAVVFCDSGLKHLEALDVKPTLIVGDFDSHCNPHLDVETIVLPCEKDDTDTVFAVKTMVQRGYMERCRESVCGKKKGKRGRMTNKWYICNTENWRHDGLCHCPTKVNRVSNPIDFYRELKTIRIVHCFRV